MVDRTDTNLPICIQLFSFWIVLVIVTIKIGISLSLSLSRPKWQFGHLILCNQSTCRHCQWLKINFLHEHRF